MPLCYCMVNEDDVRLSFIWTEKAEPTSVPGVLSSIHAGNYRAPSDGGSCRSVAEQLDVGGAVTRRREKGPRHCTGGGSCQATPHSCC